jgi:thiol-disulfide isomerase/thioredoxin
MRATGRIIVSLIPFLWHTAHAAAPSKPPAPPTAAQPIAFGDKFPGGVFENMNAGVGGPVSINLGEVIGRKPVVLCMWSVGHHRSEQVFQELQTLIQEVGPQKVALYGILPEGSNKDRDAVRQRLQEMKIAVPVLLDSNYKFIYGLGVLRPPFIAVLDKNGMLRLAGGSSLKQTLEYKMTLEDGIRRVASTGALGTYGLLRDYYPAVEMVGKKVPEFEVNGLDGKPRRWSTILDPRKPTVLVFWAVTCPHCQKILPSLNEWAKANPQGVNLVSVAAAPNETVRTKTQEYTTQQGLVFPVLLDPDMKLNDIFLVVSTPTMVIVRPDGVVDSVLTLIDQNFAKTLEAKSRELSRPS